MKPWWQYLLDLLAGLWSKGQLEAAGASPDPLQAAVTTQIDLPTLSTTPCPPPGILESRDLAHCHPELVKRYVALKAEFESMTVHQLF